MAELIGRPLVRRECPLGKVGYPTKRAAQAALKQHAHRDSRRFTRSFRCDYCDEYHLGHRRGR